MPSLLKTLSRNLRSRDDDSASDPYSDELEGSSPSVLVDGEEWESDEEDDAPTDLSDGDDDPMVLDEPKKTKSFGQAVAQSTGKKRKRNQSVHSDDEGMLQGLRDQLQMLKDGKRIKGDAAPKKKSKSSRASEQSKAVSKQSQETNEPSVGDGAVQDDHSDSDSSAAPTSVTTKRSKHAPSAVSSTKAVSRKRTVVSDTKPLSARSRDPRFLAVAGPAQETDQFKKNYAFLNEYRQSEIASMKERLGLSGKGLGKGEKKGQAPLKRSKAPKLTDEERASLKKDLVRMESQEQTRREKERIEEVTRRHRKLEREQVQQGKRPFYLKKSEQKRLAIVDKFEGMKGKQRDKAIDRRRKKMASKERKAMPINRRRSAD